MSQIVNARGIVTSFRRGRSRTHEGQILCKIDGFDNRKTAALLIGHEVEWTSPTGVGIRGKITRTHGVKGCVRVRLESKGLPGNAIGQSVSIVK
jgi:ribosomal protein L35AE/L33A